MQDKLQIFGAVMLVFLAGFALGRLLADVRNWLDDDRNDPGPQP